MSMPTFARAIAFFNPAAPDAGFVQPLLAASGGDNRSFVQVIEEPHRIEAFHPVTWPGRDFISLDTEVPLETNGPALWGFQFSDTEWIVAYWNEFRALMHERVHDPRLRDRPLLLFDVVDTLDFQDLKRETYLRAYRKYAELGEETAQNWRDRAILEPALARAWRGSAPILSAGDRVGQRTHSFRAKLVDNQVRIYSDGNVGAGMQDALQRSYEELMRMLPELFPGTGIVVSAERPRPRPIEPVAARRDEVLIVIVGDIARGIDASRSWLPRGASVVHADYFHPDPVSRPSPMLTIILGAQRDWRQMAALADRITRSPVLIVALGTTATPVLRDLQFQAEAGTPTVSFFAPFATSPKLGRDPVKTIAPLIGFLLTEFRRRTESEIEQMLPARHMMLVRESLWSDQTRPEVSCRIASRAVKAGAMPGGGAIVFSQGHVPQNQLDLWASDLSKIFRVEESSDVQLSAKRGALLLLVERRSQMTNTGDPAGIWQTIRNLFIIRGWQVTDSEGWTFAVRTEDRKFQVTIVDEAAEIPRESAGARTPGLTQAPLLVIHTDPKREQLLIGNRGQFFHASMDDIALMEPGTDWVWPVLARQLFDNTPRITQAALRLCAALIVEAVRLGNVHPTIFETNWNHIAGLLAGPDCERFIMFQSQALIRNGTTLYIEAGPDETQRERIVVHLTIERNGPTVSRLAS